jgi:hypothetical protein
MHQIDALKLRQENQQLNASLGNIREQLRRLKRIPCADVPERIACGPNSPDCWTMLRAVLRPAISAKVIEALDCALEKRRLFITRLSQGVVVIAKRRES